MMVVVSTGTVEVEGWMGKLADVVVSKILGSTNSGMDVVAGFVAVMVAGVGAVATSFPILSWTHMEYC